MKQTSKQYADYLLRKMTVDLTIDFEQTKLCSLVAIDEILKLKNTNYYKNVKLEIEKL
tara:strand:- start:38 stop:211 length:174 start_codon:yes stop_codon:yes gene_type:complete